jgi:OmpA-OmpF porin, OOP family
MNWRNPLLGLTAFLLCAASLCAQTADYRNYKDPALFTRIPNFFLHQQGSFVEKQFDAFDFPVTQGTKTAKQRVEGHYLFYIYRFNEASGPIPSPLQIIRNYQAAAAKIGGRVMGDVKDGRWTTLMLARGGQEIWAFVEAYYGGKEYHLTIVERQVMQQDVLANAEAFQAGLKEKGHVEVPGIYFDFGKSDVKAESEGALQEVVKLLQANPSLKVWVVGHTDSVGSTEANVKLSNERAAAVVKVLSGKMGIDPKRLAPYGVGPYSPVASNVTEEGRAKNRRVELVDQQ